jgi:hypothetical protein
MSLVDAPLTVEAVNRNTPPSHTPRYKPAVGPALFAAATRVSPGPRARPLQEITGRSCAICQLYPLTSLTFAGTGDHQTAKLSAIAMRRGCVKTAMAETPPNPGNGMLVGTHWYTPAGYGLQLSQEKCISGVHADKDLVFSSRTKGHRSYIRGIPVSLRQTPWCPCLK